LLKKQGEKRIFFKNFTAGGDISETIHNDLIFFIISD